MVWWNISFLNGNKEIVTQMWVKPRDVSIFQVVACLWIIVLLTDTLVLFMEPCIDVWLIQRQICALPTYSLHHQQVDKCTMWEAVRCRLGAMLDCTFTEYEVCSVFSLFLSDWTTFNLLSIMLHLVMIILQIL